MIYNPALLKTHSSGHGSGELRRPPSREGDSSEDEGENDLEELYRADEARRKADEDQLIVVSVLDEQFDDAKTSVLSH